MEKTIPTADFVAEVRQLIREETVHRLDARVIILRSNGWEVDSRGTRLDDSDVTKETMRKVFEDGYMSGGHELIRTDVANMLEVVRTGDVVVSFGETLGQLNATQYETGNEARVKLSVASAKTSSIHLRLLVGLVGANYAQVTFMSPYVGGWGDRFKSPTSHTSQPEGSKMSKTISTEEFSLLVATRVKRAHVYSHHVLNTRVFIRTSGVHESHLQWLQATSLVKTLHEFGVDTVYNKAGQLDVTVHKIDEGEIFIDIFKAGENRTDVAVDVYARGAYGDLSVQPLVKATLLQDGPDVTVETTLDVEDAIHKHSTRDLVLVDQFVKFEKVEIAGLIEEISTRVNRVTKDIDEIGNSLDEVKSKLAHLFNKESK